MKKFLLIIPALMALLASCEKAEDPKTTMDFHPDAIKLCVQVADSSGKLLEGAVVHLFESVDDLGLLTKAKYAGATDANGYAYFPDVTLKNYFVFVYKGYDATRALSNGYKDTPVSNFFATNLVPGTYNVFKVSCKMVRR